MKIFSLALLVGTGAVEKPPELPLYGECSPNDFVNTTGSFVPHHMSMRSGPYYDVVVSAQLQSDGSLTEPWILISSRIRDVDRTALHQLETARLTGDCAEKHQGDVEVWFRMKYDGEDRKPNHYEIFKVWRQPPFKRPAKET